MSNYLNDPSKLAKVINLNYNIKPSYIIENNENVLEDFFRKTAIILSSKYPSLFPQQLTLDNLDELTFTYLIAQIQINFKSDYNYFLLYFFDLLEYIITTRDKIDEFNLYTFNDNFEETVRIICNYVRTNTLFDLRRTMRKDGLSKFKEIITDSDGDGVGDFADLLPDDNRYVRVKKVVYFKHKTSNNKKCKYVKKTTED